MELIGKWKTRAGLTAHVEKWDKKKKYYTGYVLIWDIKRPEIWHSNGNALSNRDVDLVHKMIGFSETSSLT